MALNSQQQAFVDKITPYAVAAGQQTGIDPRIIIAQAALETGWGQNAPQNNYFGIKGSGASLPTQEFVNGREVNTTAHFAGYPSMQASTQGYADVMGGSRYAPVRSAQGLDAQASALGRSGYATEPDYGSQVLSIAKSLPAVGTQVAAAQPTAYVPQGGAQPSFDVPNGPYPAAADVVRAALANDPQAMQAAIKALTSQLAGPMIAHGLGFGPDPIEALSSYFKGLQQTSPQIALALSKNFQTNPALLAAVPEAARPAIQAGLAGAAKPPPTGDALGTTGQLWKPGIKSPIEMPRQRPPDNLIQAAPGQQLGLAGTGTSPASWLSKRAQDPWKGPVDAGQPFSPGSASGLAGLLGRSAGTSPYLSSLTGGYGAATTPPPFDNTGANGNNVIVKDPSILTGPPNDVPAPPGYRWTADGGIEPISSLDASSLQAPGGAPDPSAWDSGLSSSPQQYWSPSPQMPYDVSSANPNAGNANLSSWDAAAMVPPAVLPPPSAWDAGLDTSPQQYWTPPADSGIVTPGAVNPNVIPYYSSLTGGYDAGPPTPIPRIRPQQGMAASDTSAINASQPNIYGGMQNVDMAATMAPDPYSQASPDTPVLYDLGSGTQPVFSLGYRRGGKRRGLIAHA